MRVSKADGSQTIDLHRDTLIAAGIEPVPIYEAQASGRTGARPGLEATLARIRRSQCPVLSLPRERH